MIKLAVNDFYYCHWDLAIEDNNEAYQRLVWKVFYYSKTINLFEYKLIQYALHDLHIHLYRIGAIHWKDGYDEESFKRFLES